MRTVQQLAQRRRGVASMLAMIYLVLFATLAIGFYAATTVSTRVVQNEIRSGQALLAAETGIEFMRYALHQVSVPPETSDANVLLEVCADLEANLNNTGNFTNGKRIDLVGSTIQVPVGSNNYINAGASGQHLFRAEITRGTGRQLVVRVIGATEGVTSGTLNRAGVELTCVPEERETAFFEKGIAAKGAITLLTRNLVTATPASQASMISYSTVNPPVTIGSSSGTPGGIAGDIYVYPGTDPTVYPGWSVGGSTINSTIMANHVHEYDPDDVPALPMPNTSVYQPFATNTYVAGQPSYTNILIPANVNPIFNSGTVIKGVVYVKQPNKVSFQGNVNITGVIVSENSGVGTLLTNQLIFSGNGGSKLGVEALPDTPEFSGLKRYAGSFIVAPGFDVQLTGNFGNLNGHIVGDKVTLSGSSASTVAGSLVALKSTLTIGGNSAVTLTPGTGTKHDALKFADRWIPAMSTYREFPVH